MQESIYMLSALRILVEVNILFHNTRTC
jgi:hypothetical protein